MFGFWGAGREVDGERRKVARAGPAMEQPTMRMLRGGRS